MFATYSRIYIQIIFAVKGKQNRISDTWKTELHQYIAGIIKGKGQKSIIVNGMPDHIHAFIGLQPSMRIADLARDIKNNSSKFINERNFTLQKFAWQEGYGVFTYAHSQVENVYNYILNQEEYHKNKSFRKEFVSLLQHFQVEYKDQYLFEWYD